MFSLILYEPEIPPNTGNIIRLCANTGAKLHLVEPMGFELDEPRLRRAGLDYREFADIDVHPSLDRCLQSLGRPTVYALSTKGNTKYTRPSFLPATRSCSVPKRAVFPLRFSTQCPTVSGSASP